MGNGVTDASPILISLFVIQGFTDCEFFSNTVQLSWGETNTYDVTYVHIIVYAVVISQFFATIVK